MNATQTTATRPETSATAAGATGIRLDGVTLELGDGDRKVTALDNVSLEVPAGRLTAIVGPSGAGKSSLLAVAGALATADSGSVTIHGTELSSFGRGQRARGRAAKFRLAHIGFVFQSGNLVPALTAADQLRLARRLAGGRRFDPMPLLESVGMAHRAKNRPGQLSGGERQRVGIARALVNDPDVLLVDEPTAALDRARSHEVVRLIAERAHEQGVAAIMVTHDHDVLEHCDEVYEMLDGRLTKA